MGAILVGIASMENASFGFEFYFLPFAGNDPKAVHIPESMTAIGSSG
jgi:hypothetical protein